MLVLLQNLQYTHTHLKFIFEHKCFVNVFFQSDFCFIHTLITNHLQLMNQNISKKSKSERNQDAVNHMTHLFRSRMSQNTLGNIIGNLFNSLHSHEILTGIFSHGNFSAYYRSFPCSPTAVACSGMIGISFINYNIPRRI